VSDQIRWVPGNQLPAGIWWRLLAVVAGAGVVSLGAQTTTPSLNEIPGTLQPLAVLLVGMGLGPLYGTLGVGLYVLLGVLGAPVFANGTAGFGGPTSGYFIGFILAALIAGLISERACAQATARATTRLIVAALIGIFMIYAGGLIWLMVNVGLSFTDALAVGFTPFIIVDLLEAAVAAAVVAILASTLRPTS
jgi:biotin transport system substrate-specific component